MLDAVAQRYGVLPSDLLLRGNSIDITIANLAQEYINRKTAEANGQSMAKRAPNLSQEEMQNMIKKVKDRENVSK